MKSFKGSMNASAARGILHRYKANGYVLRHPAVPRRSRPGKLDLVADELMQYKTLYDMRCDSRDKRADWLKRHRNINVTGRYLGIWYKARGVRYRRPALRFPTSVSESRRQQMQKEATALLHGLFKKGHEIVFIDESSFEPGKSPVRTYMRSDKPLVMYTKSPTLDTL